MSVCFNNFFLWCVSCLVTHWGRVTHIWVSKIIIIGSDTGLSPDWRQAIIWTNAGILLIGPLGTNFIEISNEIYTFSFKKMHLKMLSAIWRLFCLGFNVLMGSCYHEEMPTHLPVWCSLKDDEILCHLKKWTNSPVYFPEREKGHASLSDYAIQTQVLIFTVQTMRNIISWGFAEIHWLQLNWQIY